MSLGAQPCRHTLQYLSQGDVESFVSNFGQYILQSTSLRDFSCEADYQALMIGLLFLLNSEYEIKSNIEMGLGYPDFTLLPNAHYSQSRLGIILELKHLGRTTRKKNLLERKGSIG